MPIPITSLDAKYRGGVHYYFTGSHKRRLCAEGISYGQALRACPQCSFPAIASGLPPSPNRHCGEPNGEPPNARADVAAAPICPVPRHMRCRPICGIRKPRHSPALEPDRAFQLRVEAARFSPPHQPRKRWLKASPQKHMQVILYGTWNLLLYRKTHASDHLS